MTPLITKLLDRLAAGLKADDTFTEPPFWQLDALRYGLFNQAPLGDERVDLDWVGYVQQVYKDDGPVFACILARQLVLSDVVFRYRTIGGSPTDLFGSPELGLLERPWPNGTTADLVMRMEIFGSTAGNAYATTCDDRGRFGRASLGGPGRRIVLMRPDWVTIVSGSPSGAESPYALDVRPVAFLYRPPNAPDQEQLLLPDEVCHWAPIPDPEARWRGMSWITPVLREIEGDKAATIHKGKFFRNGATPAMAIALDKEVSVTAFDAFKARFEETHKGADNAYKTLFLGGGADVRPLTMDLRQLEFKATQGAGETRIAAAARVPPIIVGLSEGLAATTYSNYAQAKRHFGDATIRPLWRSLAGSLQVLVERPDRAPLWYDDRDVAFLREDRKDAADIQRERASTIRQLTDAGFTPESVIAAVEAEDFTLLKHSGLYSVQLQKPGQPGAGAAPKDVVDELVRQALVGAGHNGNGKGPHAH